MGTVAISTNTGGYVNTVNVYSTATDISIDTLVL